MQKNEMISKMASYQSFASAAAMLRTVDFYFDKFRFSGKTALVLRFLAGRSKEVPGVSYLKVDTIAESELVQASDRTVRRAINKLVEAGVVTKYAQFRDKQGGDGANIYVINCSIYASVSAGLIPAGNPVDNQDDRLGVRPDVRAGMSGRSDAGIPHESSAEAASPEAKKDIFKKAEKSSIHKYVKDYVQDKSIEEMKQEIIEVEKPGKEAVDPRKVPQLFIDHVSTRYRYADQIEYLWNRVVIACRANKAPHKPVVYASIGVDAFEIAMDKKKTNVGEGIKNGETFDAFCSYFYGTVNKLIAQEIAEQARREVFESQADFYEKIYGPREVSA
jgi:hypothetical protein